MFPIAIADHSRAEDLLDMNLEEFRVAEGMTYAALADFLGIPQPRTVKLYALGAMWPSAERIDAIELGTGGRVTVLAMHRQRLQFVRKSGGHRKPVEVSVSTG